VKSRLYHAEWRQSFETSLGLCFMKDNFCFK